MTVYTKRNFRTQKELREAVEAGEQVQVYQPGGIFTNQKDGKVYLEGPHYPEPHKWYAAAIIKDGVIVKLMK